ncbi:MAG TPA: serine hydrolase domain-containing protein [Acidimicrobiales bacterium]|nr:serine hydrolase domain-containing protein [Acidimicrobiales bacterium]
MAAGDLQQEVDDVVDELIESGAEVGVQVTVIHRGEQVVNVARGLADPRTGRPVAADTLFWAASTAKGVASSIAHVLADRGVLDYDMPLVEVWPEFATGKQGVTVRQVLCHTAGVPGLPAGLTASELCDWDHMCALLADAEPWWEPGTRFGYHEYTFGFLLGETLRRLTGHTISELLHELITLPLGVADEVHFGVPDRLLPRVAHQVARVGATPQLPDPDSPHARALPAAIAPTAGLANRPEILRSDIPSM